jgi:hypothetical protein
MIHQGRLLPARKYDSALCEARFETHHPTQDMRIK